MSPELMVSDATNQTAKDPHAADSPRLAVSGVLVHGELGNPPLQLAQLVA
jgi:hypothetical protein